MSLRRSSQESSPKVTISDIRTFKSSFISPFEVADPSTEVESSQAPRGHVPVH